MSIYNNNKKPMKVSTCLFTYTNNGGTLATKKVCKHSNVSRGM